MAGRTSFSRRRALEFAVMTIVFTACRRLGQPASTTPYLTSPDAHETQSPTPTIEPTPLGTPTPRSSTEPVIALAAGGAHSLALRHDGRVWAWGSNGFGQLGNGAISTGVQGATSMPTLIPDLASVVAISAGGNVSLALKGDSTVWAWGQNDVGQVGDGTTIDRSSPVVVLQQIVAISSQSSHSLALASDGLVWAWGSNEWGQVGGESAGIRTSPAQVGLSGTIAVAAGGTSSIALKEDGSVWAWGNNRYNMLGVRSDGHRVTQPLQVIGLTNVMKIAGGETDFIALTNDGILWEWGDYRSPTSVSNLGNIVAISAGYDHRVALSDDGYVWTWGINSDGQLGNGSLNLDDFETHFPPARVVGLDHIVGIAAGSRHTLALRDDGTVWAWGDGNAGQLGTGRFQVEPLPVEVDF